MRHMNDEAHATPLMRLQDPEQTKVIIVTLPEATPVLEAEQLASDIERASIRPWAWVVNQSLAAAHPTSALLRRRASAEKPYLDQVAPMSRRHALIALRGQEPSGVDTIRELVTP
jgi:arsenite-transporting ATPase